MLYGRYGIEKQNGLDFAVYHSLCSPYVPFTLKQPIGFWSKIGVL